MRKLAIGMAGRAGASARRGIAILVLASGLSGNLHAASGTAVASAAVVDPVAVSASARQQSTQSATQLMVTTSGALSYSLTVHRVNDAVGSEPARLFAMMRYGSNTAAAGVLAAGTQTLALAADAPGAAVSIVLSYD